MKIVPGFKVRYSINVAVVESISEEKYNAYLTLNKNEGGIAYNKYKDIVAFDLESKGKKYFFEILYGDDIKLNKVSKTYVLGSKNISYDLYESLISKFMGDFTIYYDLINYKNIASAGNISNDEAAIMCLEYITEKKEKLANNAKGNIAKARGKKKVEQPAPVLVKYTGGDINGNYTLFDAIKISAIRNVIITSEDDDEYDSFATLYFYGKIPFLVVLSKLNETHVYYADENIYNAYGPEANFEITSDDETVKEFILKVLDAAT